MRGRISHEPASMPESCTCDQAERERVSEREVRERCERERERRGSTTGLVIGLSGMCEIWALILVLLFT